MCVCFVPQMYLAFVTMVALSVVFAEPEPHKKKGGGFLSRPVHRVVRPVVHHRPVVHQVPVVKHVPVVQHVPVVKHAPVHHVPVHHAPVHHRGFGQKGGFKVKHG